MERFHGVIGVIFILGLAYLCSNNKKKINFRLVASGLTLQIVIAILVLRVAPVQHFFEFLGKGMQKIEQFAKVGVLFRLWWRCCNRF
ncbi:Na+ dependent nucleoside transporter N-terminal domain-containing protein [Pedobacter sp. NJ-S-72]